MSNADKIRGDILRQVAWHAEAEKQILAEIKKREEQKKGKEKK